MYRLIPARPALLLSLLCAALLTAGISGCSGPGTPPAATRSAVLLVTIDTLPAFRVGCYGAPDVRTPEIDRLARQGVQVRDGISPVPLTLPTHATLMTGLDPPAHGVRENGLFVLEDAQVTVAELLPAEVAKAAFVGAFPVASRFGLSQGFDVYDDAFPERMGSGRRHQPMRIAREVLEPAAEWIQSADAGESPFLWVHLFDPHYPYDPPLPWRRVASTLGGGPYEGEVGYLDRELGRFFRRAGAHGARRTSTVVLTADHGESLGEHRELTHGIFVYDSTQRVPLIAAGPGIGPRLDSRQRPLVDVAPTLLAALGREPHGAHAGVPLQQPPPAERTAYVETKHTELLRGWSALYGIRTDRWKYVRAPRPELYDLAADPAESHDRIGDHPDVARRLSEQLDEILALEAAGEATAMPDDVAEKLRALGYVATAEPGGTGDPEKDPKDLVESAVALFRGEEAYLAGNLPAAEAYLRRAVQGDPDAKEGHSYLAGTYYGLGRYPLAVHHAERSLELPPHLNDAPVFTTLGEAFLAMNRRQEAIDAFRESLRLKPGDRKTEGLLQQAQGGAR